MLDARFSQLYFGPSLNTLQCGLPAIAGLLVYGGNQRLQTRVIICRMSSVCHHYTDSLHGSSYWLKVSVFVISGVTRVEGRGQPRGQPRVTSCRGDTRSKIIFVADFTKRVDKWGRTVKKVRGDTLQGGDTRVKSIKVTVRSKKGRRFFRRK